MLSPLQALEERLKQEQREEVHALKEAHRRTLDILRQQSDQELQTLRFELEDEGKAKLGELPLFGVTSIRFPSMTTTSLPRGTALNYRNDFYQHLAKMFLPDVIVWPPAVRKILQSNRLCIQGLKCTRALKQMCSVIGLNQQVIMLVSTYKNKKKNRFL